MQMPETRNPAARRDDLATRVKSIRHRTHQHLTPRKLPTLLSGWADFVDEIVLTLSEGQNISLAGRRCLAHAADRMREAAEVLRACS